MLHSEKAAGRLLKNQPPPAFLYHSRSQLLAASLRVSRSWWLWMGTGLQTSFLTSAWWFVCQRDSGVALLCTGPTRRLLFFLLLLLCCSGYIILQITVKVESPVSGLGHNKIHFEGCLSLTDSIRLQCWHPWSLCSILLLCPIQFFPELSTCSLHHILFHFILCSSCYWLNVCVPAPKFIC